MESWTTFSPTLQQLFYRDIAVRLRMGVLFKKDLWKGREPPIPLNFRNLPSDAMASTQDTADGESLSNMQVPLLQEDVQCFLDAYDHEYARTLHPRLRGH